MHTWIELKGDALKHNIKTFKNLYKGREVAFVVKSNAYGHGLSSLLPLIKSNHNGWLCVNYVTEGVQLRSEGYDGKVLVVGPVLKEDIETASQQNLQIVVGHQELLENWLSSPEHPFIHLKVETGLNRQGFSAAELRKVVTKIGPLENKVVGLLTHFANVEDITDPHYALMQVDRFQSAHKLLKDEGYNLLRHAASSASTLLMEGAHFDMCRVGISLYGFWPSQITRLSYFSQGGADLTLEPVLSWYTSVASVKSVEAGAFIGYGCAYKAPRDMKVAVLSVGYYEGYPRLAGQGQAHVLIQGVRCQVLGRIYMNMMMVDVSHLTEVAAGEKVTLLGCDGHETISAEDLANWAQTIQYEIVTRLCPQIPRRVV